MQGTPEYYEDQTHRCLEQVEHAPTPELRDAYFREAQVYATLAQAAAMESIWRLLT